MKNIKKPEAEGTLFEVGAYAWWSSQLSVNALQRLEKGWQGVFQRVILGLLEASAEALGSGFDEEIGRPSKELYAMSGLLLIAEFKNWTIEETAEAWTLDAGVQYALHLPRKEYLSERTVDTYRRKVRENVDVQEVFTRVTAALVEELQADIRQQRLDSTHVLSQMAQLGRQQLLAVAVRRFLTQLKKHDANGYAAVGTAMRERYEAAETRLFGFGSKQAAPREQVLQQVAEDLAWLVEHFGGSESVREWKSFQALAQLLREHCEVRVDKTVGILKQSRDAKGGSTQCLQNPSDPEAGYSGHKGAGYQVQLAQALPARDEEGKIEGPGLVVACVPQSAAVRDNEALAEVLAQQQAAKLLPEQTLADAIYGSDANVQACAELGVKLLSPVCGNSPSKKAPSHHCTKAELGLKARLANRRAAQETADWKREYAKRNGIEGLHRALDATTGLKTLRVRGARAVTVAVTLKVTGWNIRAAAQTLAQRARRARAKGGPGGVRGPHGLRNDLHGRSCPHSAHPRRQRRFFARRHPLTNR
jgi:Transposase DDE domain/Transposase domain (DUF772)